MASRASNERRGRSKGLGVEQWAVLGFSALGLFAVYRLLKASRNEPALETAPDTTPLLDVSRVPMLPANIVRADKSARLQTNQAYRGRIELPSTPPAGVLPPRPPTGDLLEFETASSTREAIASALQRAGFSNVAVFMNVAEATPEIPLPVALEGAGTGSRWFTATWAKPSGVQPKMGNIVLLWPTVS